MSDSPERIAELLEASSVNPLHLKAAALLRAMAAQPGDPEGVAKSPGIFVGKLLLLAESSNGPFLVGEIKVPIHVTYQPNLPEEPK